MELEKEISQKNFRSEQQKAMINLIYTYHWINNIARQDFIAFDITMQQFNILRILRGQYPNPSSINLLRERMLDKMCDASRMVDRLKQKELIERCVNKKDKRSVDIVISQKGLDLLSKIDQEIDMDRAISKLSDEDAKTLNTILDKMRG
ncbi:MAG: MarR family transcriptional regulator [Sphingobacteriales bacterium]|jgi:DNA-binding MarR family transcriptional regulator|nr:MarR family transcriptional regulator [Sphingobacteriales bacterium]